MTTTPVVFSDSGYADHPCLEGRPRELHGRTNQSDASEVPAIQMRALFEQFHYERG